MQLRKPNNTRSLQASRGPAGAGARTGAEGEDAVLAGALRGAAWLAGAGSGMGEAAGALGRLVDAGVGAPGALAFLAGSTAFSAEAARAGSEAVAVADWLLGIVLVAIMLLTDDESATVLELDGVIATLVALTSGVVILVVGVTLLVATCANGSGAGLRVNQKSAAPIVRAAAAISIQDGGITA